MALSPRFRGRGARTDQLHRTGPRRPERAMSRDASMYRAAARAATGCATAYPGAQVRDVALSPRFRGRGPPRARGRLWPDRPGPRRRSDSGRCTDGAPPPPAMLAPVADAVVNQESRSWRADRRQGVRRELAAGCGRTDRDRDDDRTPVGARMVRHRRQRLKLTGGRTAPGLGRVVINRLRGGADSAGSGAAQSGSPGAGPLGRARRRTARAGVGNRG